MSHRTPRTPFAAVVVALALFVLPSAGEAASLSRLRLPQTAGLRILARLERLENVLLKGMTSLWQQAGARIDDNGRS
jgi:hypothetical protein